MANTIWRIELDRFGDESKAKSGKVSSVEEACDALIREYEKQVHKPELEIVTIGIGAALADMLEGKNIEFRRIIGHLNRIDGADILIIRNDAAFQPL